MIFQVVHYNRKAMISLLNEHHVPADCCSESYPEGRKRNEDREKNFGPVIIDNTCCIRAPFHPVRINKLSYY